eukprot:Amastigsp_a2667_5.p8 type:complete len:102 gc:universal Amastigsp_a2667_5:323-18(-)
MHRGCELLCARRMDDGALVPLRPLEQLLERKRRPRLSIVRVGVKVHDALARTRQRPCERGLHEPRADDDVIVRLVHREKRRAHLLLLERLRGVHRVAEVLS